MLNLEKISAIDKSTAKILKDGQINYFVTTPVTGINTRMAATSSYSMTFQTSRNTPKMMASLDGS